MPTVDVQLPDLSSVGKSLVDVSANLVLASNSIPSSTEKFADALTKVAGFAAASTIVYSVTSLFRAPNILVVNAGGSSGGEAQAAAIVAAGQSLYRSSGWTGLWFTLWLSTAAGLITLGLVRERAIRAEVQIRQLELDAAEEEMRRSQAEEMEEMRRDRTNLVSKIGKSELLKQDVRLEQLLTEDTTRQIFSMTPKTFETPGLLKFNGSAKQGAGVSTIVLTEAAANQAGSVFLEQQVDLAKGFICEFSFRMLRDRGDGIAFVLQGIAPSALGMHGYGLGYSGLDRCLALEFDSFRNKDVGDPQADWHLAVMMAQSGKTTSHHSNAIVWAGPEKVPKFNNGHTHVVRVVWDPEAQREGEALSGAGLFKVLWRINEMFTPVISQRLRNLGGQVGSFPGKTTAWLGFSGGTGGSYQKQEIVSWQLYEEDVVIEGPKTVALTTDGGAAAVDPSRITVAGDGKGSAAAVILGEIVKAAGSA